MKKWRIVCALALLMWLVNPGNGRAVYATGSEAGVWHGVDLQENPSELTEEETDETSEERSNGATAEVSEGRSSGATAEVSEERSNGATAEASKERSNGATAEVSEGRSNGATAEVSKERSNGATAEASEEGSNGATAEASEGRSDEASAEVPEESSNGSACEVSDKAAKDDGSSDITENLIGDYLDLDALEAGFRELSDNEQFSMRKTITGLLKGEIPFALSDLPELISDLFLSELRQQKQMALQILIIVFASAIFSNFIKVFDNSQIADISFYMMYLLISTLLVRAFSSMNAIVLETCTNMNDFMKLLLPSYLVTVVLSSGSISAVGFYEITVLAINLIQVFIIKIILPAINFYLILLILNQMAKEDYFSRFAELVETVISWVIKTILGLVLGLQAVQCLIAPAVDSLKSSAVHRLAKTIPGIGSVIDSAAETVAGSAVVIKNAVGVAGMLALVVMCATPLLKLAACILMFRLLCALIQPISEKRMIEGIESISHGTVLLLRVLGTGMAVFLISLAMITASVRGG